MSTETQSDLHLICAAIAEGRKVDPEVARRARERSEALQTPTPENFSVELLREARQE